MADKLQAQSSITLVHAIMQKCLRNWMQEHVACITLAEDAGNTKNADMSN